MVSLGMVDPIALTTLQQLTDSFENGTHPVYGHVMRK